MKLWSVLAWFLVVCSTIGSGLAQTPLYFGCGETLPYAVDFDGDGRAELTLFDPVSGTLSARGLGGNHLACDTLISESGFCAAFADYDGDGLADPASFDHASGMWYFFASRLHYDLEMFQGAVGLDTTVPVPADYDKDGLADPALYEPTLGVWIIYPSTMEYQPVVFHYLGAHGCVPVPADYDGDGSIDPAVYDEQTGLWTACLSGSGYAPQFLAYGGPGCAAAPADFDGDGKADPAVYNAALGVWGILHSSSNYTPNIVVQGGPGCVPVPGKYYFTNSADFAVYNPANGSWVIAYESPLDAGSFQDYVSAVLPSLLTGNWKAAVAGGIGWVLNLIFNHGEEPEDPHWAEMRAILSEMNGKLDQLLALSQNVLSELNKLSLQLKYESAHTRLLISELLARQAFATIGSLYDSTGPEGYRHFYNCDTNNPPSCQTVERFTDKVLSKNMPECILQIQQTIQPLLATERGVLRQWVDLAKMRGVTPDNLMDHYRALFAYFSTLYSFQVKAGALYADAMRQRYTNDVDKIGIQTWITNDFRGMLQAGVDEFRGATYELAMAAITAADVPAHLANPMAIPNVNEALSVTEFFAFKWLAQPTTMCVTFLAVDRPETIEKYNSVLCKQWIPEGRIVNRRSVTSVNVCGRPYGFTNPDIKKITVNDRYAFIRVDYPPRLLSWNMRLFGSGYESPVIPIQWYDNNMQTTTVATARTNKFIHVFASPWNHEVLTLPMDASATGDWWAGRHDYCKFMGLQPGDKSFRYMPWNRSWPYNGQQLNGRLFFNLEMEISYDVASGRSLPANCGVDPWLYAYSYPFTVSNMTDRPVSGVRAHVASRTYVAGQRWDSTGSRTTYVERKAHQYWVHGGGGVVWFSDGQRSYWWRQGPKELHPAGQERRTARDWRWSENNIVAYRNSQLPSGTGVPLRLGVGAQIQLLQDCYSGYYGAAFQPSYAWAWVDIYVDQIAISFY